MVYSDGRGSIQTLLEQAVEASKRMSGGEVPQLIIVLLPIKVRRGGG